VGNLRLVLAVDVTPGNQHTSKHSSPRLWKFASLVFFLTAKNCGAVDPARTLVPNPQRGA
jgi:hypothetical protein